MKTLLPILFLFQLSVSNAQTPQWEILSPTKDSITEAENIFIAFAINNFSSINTCEVLIDNQPINNIKLSGNRVTCLLYNPLSAGRHTILVKALLPGIAVWEQFSWNFYVNRFGEIEKKTKSSPSVLTAPNITSAKPVFSGNVSADYRSTALSGDGLTLRQEPGFTRTISADLKFKHKNLEIPIKFYNTSDNATGILPRNFFQIGIKLKWLEAFYGDINPNFDKLILSGVRVTGVSTKLKIGKSSLQAVYGDLVREGVNGNLLKYTPGQGFIPTTLINDTQYVVPGVYKRWMAGARFEFVSRKEKIRYGFTAFKAKDDLNSISYGLTPKDNLAAGIDIGLKFFKKTVSINAAVAASLFTNDISYGTLNTASLDTNFKIKVNFDAKAYENFIIINSTTIPGNPDNATDALSWYANIGHSSGTHSFVFEYRNNGPSYYSLGNPFLRNNYTGYTVTERFALAKRKITFSGTYQDYYNNTNNTLGSNLNCKLFSGSLGININPKWPVFALTYLNQTRDGKSLVDKLPNTKDAMNYYMANVSYRTSFWKIDHSFRVMYSYNSRKDAIRPTSENTMNNYMVGISETFSKNFSFNADFGKTKIADYTGTDIANITVYSGFLEWQIQPQKFFTSIGYANNQTLVTTYSPESFRASIIARLGYRFLQGMGIDIEGGLMPYREQIAISNNYDEKYVYLRWFYNFSTAKKK